MQVESNFKRSHEKRQFKLEKITDAILKAMISVDNGNLSDAEHIAAEVNKSLIARAIKIPNYTPTVEEIHYLLKNRRKLLFFPYFSNHNYQNPRLAHLV